MYIIIIIMLAYISRCALHSSSLIIVLLLFFVTARSYHPYLLAPICTILHLSIAQAWNSVGPHFCTPSALLHPKRIQAARVEQSLLSLPVLEPCVKYRNTKRSAFNTFGGSNQAVLNSTSRLPKPCLLGAKDGNPRFIMRHHLKRFRTRD